MTRALDFAYRTAGVLAGVFLVAIAVIVTAQIVARLFDRMLPSADEFAGFCLAATSFLGLAYAFRAGSHIRVTLFVQRLRGAVARVLLVVALAVATAVTSLFAWHTVLMVGQNFWRGEVTSGLVPLPLWLPQLGMAIGVVLFALAIIEDLVRVLRGGQPIFAGGESDQQKTDSIADEPR